MCTGRETLLVSPWEASALGRRGEGREGEERSHEEEAFDEVSKEREAKLGAHRERRVESMNRSSDLTAASSMGRRKEGET